MSKIYIDRENNYTIISDGFDEKSFEVGSDDGLVYGNGRSRS